MLPFIEIKKDYKAGFDYFEYEGTWYGLDYVFLLEGNKLLVNFYDFKNMLSCHYPLYMDEVLEMTYKEYVKTMNQIIYYNLNEPIDSYDDLDYIENDLI